MGKTFGFILSLVSSVLAVALLLGAFGELTKVEITIMLVFVLDMLAIRFLFQRKN